MMASLKLGPFVELEKPLSSLVIDISSIGLCFIVLIGCSVENRLIMVVHSNMTKSFPLFCGDKLLVLLFKIIQRQADLAT
jgi:hypothetical protein